MLSSVKRTLFTRWIPNISSSVGLLHKGEQIIKYIRFRQRLKTVDANLSGIQKKQNKSDLRGSRFDSIIVYSKVLCFSLYSIKVGLTY